MTAQQPALNSGQQAASDAHDSGIHHDTSVCPRCKAEVQTIAR